ncbi:tripartite tricarboxylate transporter substrate binding protein [uncultured Pigmentiphaga sp.]|uniref:Bug family tripartite tricarboxylate transporter substrate binding protein n=1 Tax=uncultured Pigmentiphaga sp. TaxID=340361 RepID=UPI002618B6E4|nr:tripartite tricarboxylate transporter substrate binding protein [uncultured Pigmentiphaga sp.]
MRSLFRTLIPVLLLLGGAAQAAQDSYPTRPVDVVVPIAPGGSNDIVARALAEQLSKILGQSFVVSNRPGGSGIIGLSYVVNAPADGYTLAISPAAFIATNPSLFKSLPYDSEKDFAPIANVVTAPRVLVVRSNSKYKTVAALVADAKRNPGKLNYGSGGEGTPHHLGGVLFADQNGLELVHVPYKGGAPAMNDLLAGHIDMMFAAASEVKPYVESGRIRALAIAGKERSAILPDVPTTTEIGFGDLELSTWTGLFGPAGMPQAAIERLNAAINKALKGDLGERFKTLGYTPIGGTPEEFKVQIQKDIKMFERLIEKSGIKKQ